MMVEPFGFKKYFTLCKVKARLVANLPSSYAPLVAILDVGGVTLTLNLQLGNPQ
jgi:hypothetical protein